MAMARNSSKTYEEIDRELEKMVFLSDAEEGNHGLYSLVWELGDYTALSIGQKYTLASELLRDLVVSGLLVVEEFEDANLKNRLRTVSDDDLDGILRNPTSWYPGQAPYFATALTTKGIAFFDACDERTMKRLDSRLLSGPL